MMPTRQPQKADHGTEGKEFPSRRSRNSLRRKPFKLQRCCKPPVLSSATGAPQQWHSEAKLWRSHTPFQLTFPMDGDTSPSQAVGVRTCVQNLAPWQSTLSIVKSRDNWLHQDMLREPAAALARLVGPTCTWRTIYVQLSWRLQGFINAVLN